MPVQREINNQLPVTTVISPVPGTPPTSQPVTVLETPLPDKAVMDLRYAMDYSLATFAAGQSATLQYFSQVLGQYAEGAGLQTSLDPALQTYHLIKDVRVKITTPLSLNSQDANTGEQNLTGTFVMGGYITPNKGDMFVMDFGSNGVMVCQLTSTSKGSSFMDSSYTVDFMVVSDQQTLVNNLMARVVKTSVFRADLLAYQRHPIIASEAASQLADLRVVYYQVIGAYVRSFYDRSVKGLLVPGQAYCHDPFLAKFLTSSFELSDCLELASLYVPDVSSRAEFSLESFWDVIQERDLTALKECFTRAGIASAMNFSSVMSARSIRLSIYTNVVAPITTPDYLGVLPFQSADDPAQTQADMLTQLAVAQGTITRAILPKVAESATYILSPAFYAQEVSTMTELDQLVWAYLNHQEVSLPIVLDTLRRLNQYGRLERFYYSPILLFLAKHLLQGGL